jgi:hypothetical protein
MVMMSKLEILDVYTSNRNISQKLVEDYENFFKKIVKRTDLILEEVLKITPFIEKLEKENISVIDKIHKNNFPNDLNTYITYLFFRSKLGKLMTLNLLTQPVIEKINTLFFDFFPNEIPNLIKNGIYIQSKNNVLFDDITKIILYNEIPGLYQQKDDRFGLILWKKDNTFIYASMVYSTILGSFAGDLNNRDFEGKTNDNNIEPFKKALIFCFVFSIILEAENTPTSVKDSNKSENIKKNKTQIKKKNTEGWIERTIYINKKIKPTKNSLYKGTLYKDDKILKEVKVSGYLKRQSYGKNNSKQKYIYIESFVSTRWVIEGDKKITYYLK